MKKVYEQKTSDGTIPYYEDEKGRLTTQKPIDGVLFHKWIVTDDPSQYAMGHVYDDEQSALEHSVKMREFQQLYVIQLSYIKEDLPPQYIHVINEDGSKLRIM